MTRASALTDRESSLAADEFVWDSAHHGEAHRYLAKPVLAELNRHSARTVLDLGCGNGSFTHQMSRHGFDATGLDGSESGIALARKNFNSAHFEHHDLGNVLPEAYRSRYDAVVSMEVIEHLLLPRQLLTNAMMALRPGGLLIVTTPYHGYVKNVAIALTNGFDKHWHPLRDYGHIKFFSRRTLTRLFQEFGLENVRFRTAGRFPLLAKSMLLSATKAGQVSR